MHSNIYNLQLVLVLLSLLCWSSIFNRRLKTQKYGIHDMFSSYQEPTTTNGGLLTVCA